ncbi:hypothetical protein GCM10020254_68810 [Streptomyces goshikiensis]
MAGASGVAWCSRDHSLGGGLELDPAEQAREARGARRDAGGAMAEPARKKPKSAHTNACDSFIPSFLKNRKQMMPSRTTPEIDKTMGGSPGSGGAVTISCSRLTGSINATKGASE